MTARKKGKPAEKARAEKPAPEVIEDPVEQVQAKAKPAKAAPAPAPKPTVVVACPQCGHMIVRS